MNKLALSEVPAIKDGRTLLKEILDIAQTLEQMQEALKAVLFLGESDSTLPPDIRKFFSEISDRLKQEKKEKLQNYIAKLDALIEKELHSIIEISESATETEHVDSFSVQSIELVKSFRRRALTAISLRMLLRKRGLEVPKISFDVPRNVVSKQLTKLKIKEKAQRGLAVRQIRKMLVDLGRLKDKEDQSEEIKDILENVIKGLENDILAINRGDSLEELPISFEQVEEDAFWHTPFYEEDSVYVVESGEEPNIGAASNKSEQRTGFIQKLLRWLNTPWAVSWKKINKDDSN